VHNEGNDVNNGLSENFPVKTLSTAWRAAGETSGPARIVILSDISTAGLVLFDAEGARSEPVTIAGGLDNLTLARVGADNDSVLEIRGGAQVVFENIRINGVVNANGSGNNRALKVWGAGTQVTLGDGAAVTGMKTGNGNSLPDESDGSGILVGGQAELILAGGKVAGCVSTTIAAYAKGAIVVYGGGITMNSGEISGNTTKAEVAGQANYGYGGGVYAYGATFTMNGGKIINNTVKATSTTTGTYGYGGGAYINSSTFVMNGGEISGNTIESNASTSAYGYGGGVSISGVFTATGGKIANNTVNAKTSATASYLAYAYGGGIYASSGVSTVAGVTVSGNTAASVANSTTVTNTNGGGRGGGIYVGSIFTMGNGAVISGNKVSGTRGAGYTAYAYAYGGGVFFSGGAFIMNGGVIYGKNAATALQNTATTGAAYYKGTDTAVSSLSETHENTVGGL
jgi:hypothetical protein